MSTDLTLGGDLYVEPDYVVEHLVRHGDALEHRAFSELCDAADISELSVAMNLDYAALPASEHTALLLDPYRPPMQQHAWHKRPGTLEEAIEALSHPQVSRQVILTVLARYAPQIDITELTSIVGAGRDPQNTSAFAEAVPDLLPRIYPDMREHEDALERCLKNMAVTRVHDLSWIVADTDAPVRVRRQAARSRGSNPQVYLAHRDELTAGLDPAQIGELDHGATSLSTQRWHWLADLVPAQSVTAPVGLGTTILSVDDLIVAAPTRADLLALATAHPESSQAVVCNPLCDLATFMNVTGRTPDEDDIVEYNYELSLTLPLWVLQDLDSFALWLDQSNWDDDLITSYPEVGRTEAAAALAAALPLLRKAGIAPFRDTERAMTKLVTELCTVLGVHEVLALCPSVELLNHVDQPAVAHAVSELLLTITREHSSQVAGQVLTIASSSAEPLSTIAAACTAAAT